MPREHATQCDIMFAFFRKVCTPTQRHKRRVAVLLGGDPFADRRNVQALFACMYCCPVIFFSSWFGTTTHRALLECCGFDVAVVSCTYVFDISLPCALQELKIKVDALMDAGMLAVVDQELLKEHNRRTWQAC